MGSWKQRILPLVTICLRIKAIVCKYCLGQKIPHPPEKLITWIFNNDFLSALEYLTDVLFTYKIFRFQNRLYLLDSRLALKAMNKLDKGATDFLLSSPLHTTLIGVPDKSPELRHVIAASLRKTTALRKAHLMEKVITRAMTKMKNMDVVNISDLTVQTSMDIVGKVLLGVELGALEGKQERFLNAMDTVLYRSYALGQVAPDSKEFKDNDRAMDEEIETIFYQCLEQNPGGDSFVHLLCKAESIDKAKSNLKLFLMAGSETTSNALSVLIDILALRPELQKELQEEADEWIVRLQEDASLVPPKLDSAFKEVLRLYAIGPYAVRQTYEELDMGDFCIPAKSNLRIFIWGIHRSPNLWKDAKNLCPLRFMTSQSTNQRNNFLPFGAGPRICPGQNLVWVEMRLMMTYFLHRFNVRPLSESNDYSFYVDWEHGVAHIDRKIILAVNER